MLMQVFSEEVTDFYSAIDIETYYEKRSKYVGRMAGMHDGWWREGGPVACLVPVFANGSSYAQALMNDVNAMNAEGLAFLGSVIVASQFSFDITRESMNDDDLFAVKNEAYGLLFYLGHTSRTKLASIERIILEIIDANDIVTVVRILETELANPRSVINQHSNLSWFCTSMRTTRSHSLVSKFISKIKEDYEIG